MKRKFEVTVTRTDSYIVEIDEDKLDKDLISDYEKDIHDLGKDKIKQLAKEIGYMSMDNRYDNYEGIGYIRTDGMNFQHKTENGIELEIEMIEDYETEIREVK